MAISARASDTAVPSPTLLSVYESQSFSTGRPLIAGVTKNDTRVAVFIDDTLNGLAQVTNDPSGTAHFSYYPFLSLKPGIHTVVIQAEKIATSERSMSSSVITFRIWDISAPTLIAPEGGVMRFDHPARAIVAGLAKNDLTVNLHVDGMLADHLKVRNHSSGTANFAFNPKVAPGTHTVFATSTDATGRISSKTSNMVTLVVEYPLPMPTVMSVTSAGDTIVVSGVAKNGSVVEVLIDGVKDGEVAVKDHTSGTAWFAYASKALVAGDHAVVIVAHDASGKKSLSSRSRTVSVGVQTQASQETEQEPEDAVPPTESEQQPEDEKQIDTGADRPQSQSEQSGEVKGEVEKSPVDIDADTEVKTSAEPQEVSVKPMNWPLISGVVILAFLVIVFVVWYLRQKKELINKSIDRIFGETESSPSSDSKEQKREEVREEIVIKEKKAISKEPPLPPPPPSP